MTFLLDPYRGVAAVPFSPSDLTGLQLWLKADGTLWQDAGRTTPATADAAPVGCWDDSSVNGRNAAQTVSANRPLLKTNILNGKPVLRFQGVDDFLVTASVLAVGADGTWTAFAVSTHTGTTVQSVLDNDHPTIRVAQFLRYHDATQVMAVAFNTAVGAFTDTQATWSGFDILEGVRTTTTVEMVLNGASGGATATTGTPKSASAPIWIGANSGTAQYLVGDIAETILYNRVLTSGERTDVRTYLTGRYGAL